LQLNGASVRVKKKRVKTVHFSTRARQAGRNKVVADLAKLLLSSRGDSGLRKGPPSFSGATIKTTAELHPEKRTWFHFGASRADIALSKLASTCC